MRFTDGSDKAADAYAVAAHHGVLFISFTVEIGHSHGRCVFGAKLKDVANLNAA